VHFLITGHTGFKGTWLSLMLNRLGHQVSGISLPPDDLSLFNLIDAEELLEESIYFDIRNFRMLKETMNKISPDIVIHLAAQSLVISGYQNPAETFEVNVNGTLNVLNATAKEKSVKAQLIITTDKVYKNDNRLTGYKETDSLGSSDPYSTSKAMADLLTQSWIGSQQTIPTAILRGGNVIGGGDFSENRIIPDFIRSIQNNSELIIRYPKAVRPWQHVIDCLDGYLTVLWNLLEEKKSDVWNIGPQNESYFNVSQLLDFAEQCIEREQKSNWEISNLESRLDEKEILLLETGKIKNELGWSSRFGVKESIISTMDWYKHYLNGFNMKEVTKKQIENYYTS
jgi:CDP-glucose 4,6-dehydratase